MEENGGQRGCGLRNIGICDVCLRLKNWWDEGCIIHAQSIQKAKDEEVGP